MPAKKKKQQPAATTTRRQRSHSADRAALVVPHVEITRPRSLHFIYRFAVRRCMCRRCEATPDDDEYYEDFPDDHHRSLHFLVDLAHVHSRWHETMTRWSADPPDMWARVGSAVVGLAAVRGAISFGARERAPHTVLLGSWVANPTQDLLVVTAGQRRKVSSRAASASLSSGRRNFTDSASESP